MTTPSREALQKRIRDLESRLRRYEKVPPPRTRQAPGDTFTRHSNEGIGVLHAVDDFPFVQFTVWNERMHDLTGFTLEAINRQGWFQVLCPGDGIRQETMTRWTGLEPGGDPLIETWPMVCADGRQRTLRIFASVIGHVDGAAQILLIIQDAADRREGEEGERPVQSELEQRIDERTTALWSKSAALARAIKARGDTENALRRSEEKFSKLFYISPVWMDVATVAEGRYIDVNDAFVATTGYAREEVIGRYSTELNLWPQPGSPAGCA